MNLAGRSAALNCREYGPRRGATAITHLSLPSPVSHVARILNLIHSRRKNGFISREHTHGGSVGPR